MAAPPSPLSPILSPGQLEALAAVGEERTAAEGEFLFRIGDARYPLIVVLEGEAAILDGAGNEIARQGPGGFLAEINLLTVMQKRARIHGSTLRARSVADKGSIARAVEHHVLPLVAAGRVKPVMDSAFPLGQAAAAHARMESSVHIGKIVLTV